MNEYNVEGRLIVFEALFGSHNYNLNSPLSDKDYKVFVCPTFDDLYANKRFSTSAITDSFDYDVHDIRQLGELFWKTNINFMEVLFSKSVIYYEEFDELYYWMSDNREEIARMNLPYLFDACVGMHHQKRKRMNGKGTESTKHLVEKYGYECKEASHAYRVLDCLQRYYENGFTSFGQAISYENSSKIRELILDMKNGEITKFNAEHYLNDKYDDVIRLKHFFQKEPNVELKEELERRIKEEVRRVMRGN